MPTYEYLCRDQGHRIEVQQKFTDDALTTCPICGGSLRKVISAPPIVFKGSGFYRNDSRAKSARSSTPSRDKDGSSSDAAKSGSDSAKPSTGSGDGAATGSPSKDAAGSGTSSPKATPSTSAPTT